MEEILTILSDQYEVKYLCYFIFQDKTGIIKLSLSAAGISKKYKFKTVDGCLSKIIDILLELKSLEAWALKRADKEK